MSSSRERDEEGAPEMGKNDIRGKDVGPNTRERGDDDKAER